MMMMRTSQKTCIRGQTCSFSNNGRSALIGSRILMQLHIFKEEKNNNNREENEKKKKGNTVGGLTLQAVCGE